MTDIIPGVHVAVHTCAEILHLRPGWTSPTTFASCCVRGAFERLGSSWVQLWKSYITGRIWQSISWVSRSYRGYSECLAWSHHVFDAPRVNRFPCGIWTRAIWGPALWCLDTLSWCWRRLSSTLELTDLLPRHVQGAVERLCDGITLVWTLAQLAGGKPFIHGGNHGWATPMCSVPTPRSSGLAQPLRAYLGSVVVEDEWLPAFTMCPTCGSHGGGTSAHCAATPTRRTQVRGEGAPWMATTSLPALQFAFCLGVHSQSRASTDTLGWLKPWVAGSWLAWFACTSMWLIGQAPKASAVSVLPAERPAGDTFCSWKAPAYGQAGLFLGLDHDFSNLLFTGAVELWPRQRLLDKIQTLIAQQDHFHLVLRPRSTAWWTSSNKGPIVALGQMAWPQSKNDNMNVHAT